MNARVCAALAVLVITVAVAAFGLLTPRDATGGPEASCPIVATIGQERLSSADLATYLYERYRADWIRTVDALLDERLVAREVRRLGLALPPGLLQKTIDEEVETRRKLLRDTYGEEADLATEVLSGYGLDLESWKRTILAPRLSTQLLLKRVIRLDTRRRDRVKARVIVLDSEAQARRVHTRLMRGADFSLTALKESKDPTARNGGDLPSIARGDLTVPGVEERLFAASAGELVGPIPVTLEGRSTWHLYKVIRRIPPWSGSREKILADLEADLGSFPLERPEFERWRARMRRDFGVRVFDPDGRPVTLPSGG